MTSAKPSIAYTAIPVRANLSQLGPRLGGLRTLVAHRSARFSPAKPVALASSRGVDAAFPRTLAGRAVTPRPPLGRRRPGCLSEGRECEEGGAADTESTLRTCPLGTLQIDAPRVLIGAGRTEAVAADLIEAGIYPWVY